MDISMVLKINKKELNVLTTSLQKYNEFLSIRLNTTDEPIVKPILEDSRQITKQLLEQLYEFL